MRSLGWLVVVTSVACAQPQPRPSYSWDIPLDQVAEFTGFQYSAGGVRVAFDKAKGGPIVLLKSQEKNARAAGRVTGMEVLGEGTATVRQDGKVVFESDVYGAMFRFHPDDYKTFIQIKERRPEPRLGLRALLLHLCYGSFRRFWHRGSRAFIPDKGAIAAWVYAKDKGGVMLYLKNGRLVGYCMDTRETLFGR